MKSTDKLWWEGEVNPLSYNFVPGTIIIVEFLNAISISFIIQTNYTRGTCQRDKNSKGDFSSLILFTNCIHLIKGVMPKPQTLKSTKTYY